MGRRTGDVPHGRLATASTASCARHALVLGRLAERRGSATGWVPRRFRCPGQSTAFVLRGAAQCFVSSAGGGSCRPCSGRIDRAAAVVSVVVMSRSSVRLRCGLVGVASYRWVVCCAACVVVRARDGRRPGRGGRGCRAVASGRRRWDRASTRDRSGRRQAPYHRPSAAQARTARQAAVPVWLAGPGCPRILREIAAGGVEVVPARASPVAAAELALDPHRLA